MTDSAATKTVEKIIPSVEEVLRPQQWQSETVAIIGGGPSLKGFDFDQLEPVKTIGCNGAYRENPDIMIGIDWRFFELVKGREDFVNCSSVKLFHQTCSRYPSASEVGAYSVPVARSSAVWGSDFSEGLANTTNTGSFAINLADILGASTIVLFGFDMKGEGGRLSNYHNLYPVEWMSCPDTVYDRFARSFERAAIYSHARIVNANPDSAITVFPRCTIDEGVALCRGEIEFDELFPSAEILGGFGGPFVVRCKAGRGSDEHLSHVVSGRTQFIENGTGRGKRVSIKVPSKLRHPGPEKSMADQKMEDLFARAPETYRHLPVFRSLAKNLRSIAEYVTTDETCTTTALIASRSHSVTSVRTHLPTADQMSPLVSMAKEVSTELTFIEGDGSRECPIEFDVDLLLIKSVANSIRLTAELQRVESRVSRFIVIPNIIKFGLRDQHPNPVDFGGLLPAIMLFMRDYPEWGILDIHTDEDGLLIMERDSGATAI